MWYLQEYVQVISLIKLPFRGKDSNNSRQWSVLHTIRDLDVISCGSNREKRYVKCDYR
jgi:glucose-6-phosphate isomerase